jgi:hypothetical protein
LKKPQVLSKAERYMKFVADAHVHLGEITTQATKDDFDLSKQKSGLCFRLYLRHFQNSMKNTRLLCNQY